MSWRPAPLFALILLLPLVMANSPRTETVRYAGSGDLATVCDPNHPTPVAHGGGCWHFLDGETQVSAHVDRDTVDGARPAWAWYSFDDRDPPTFSHSRFASAFFCGQVTVPIPSGATRVIVSASSVHVDTSCEPDFSAQERVIGDFAGIRATSGTISVTFT